jgi:dephospho-CoA kinase
MNDRGAPHRAVKIGITGPIGCGKSTIADYLGDHPWIMSLDADQIARDVTRVGEPTLAAVIERFGSEYLKPDGSLDRQALGDLVFADPIALQDLEAIVHPPVRARIVAAITKADEERWIAVVIEAIKLVEGGLAGLCDEVWLVTCNPDVQRVRLMERGATTRYADSRIAAQGRLVERLEPAATRILDTSGDLRTTFSLAGDLLGRALASAAESDSS